MSSTERLLSSHEVDDPVFASPSASVQVRMPRICGPKLSNCCFILSIWGIVMLIFLGVFFKFEAVALTEDIPHGNIKKGYSGTAMNCFIAAGIYGVTFLISAYQKWAISRGYARL